MNKGETVILTLKAYLASNLLWLEYERIALMVNNTINAIIIKLISYAARFSSFM